MASSTHYRSCNLCEAMCGLAIEVTDGIVASIRGDRDDPFSRGYLCPKAVALKDVHEDPDRLRTPVRRTATGWQPISWDAAIDETATRLRAVQQAHGRDAVAVYAGNPTVHNHGALLFGRLLRRALGTRNSYSATSVDQLPQHVVASFLYGHQLLVPVPDIDRTHYLVIVGGNPAVSNGSLMSAPDARGRLQAIRQRGGTVIVIDPRRTETADLADRHHFITPGTDALLLLGLLHVVCADGGGRVDRLADFIDGHDRIARIVAAYPPDQVATATGMPAEAIRRLAREFVAAPSAVCYARMGASTQRFGTLTHWLVQVLNIATGNLDREGGAMFTRPAFDLVEYAGPGHLGRRRTRVRGLPEFGGEFPVAALAEEIATPGAGQARALVTLAGNPVLSTPNGAQLDRILPTLEFMVSLDCYVNETTRHAHLILPPTSTLERSHVEIALPLFAVRNVARFSAPVFEPPAGARHDWQILHALVTRLGARRAGRLRDRLGRIVEGALGPDRLVDLALRTGPYGVGFRPWRRGLSLRALRRAPHGLDLGPLAPCLPRRLRTASKRIDLVPDVFVADLDRLASETQYAAPAFRTKQGPPASRPDAPATIPLRLIGRRHLHSNNSWMHNTTRLVKGPVRCTLLMHPVDAAARSLRDGDVACVASRTGSIHVPVEVSDEMMPGVVSVPHGWGHGRAGVRLSVASQHPGASVNDVTDETFLDEISGNAALNGVPVTVAPVVAPEHAGPESSEQELADRKLC